MRQLILFRHAKTEAYAIGQSDETRALTERGRADAAAMAEHLKEDGISPDIALISTARRTRETWAITKKTLGDIKEHFVPSLYLAEPNELKAILAEYSQAGSVLMIGHNPGFHDLAVEMATNGGHQDYVAWRTLMQKFPTGGAAVFNAPEDTVFHSAGFKLSAFFIPKAI